jgi:N-acetylglucosaminyldiphosphoundecaprenol N-acetyl-beta-D-mannosaminyltransferase
VSTSPLRAQSSSGDLSPVPARRRVKIGSVSIDALVLSEAIDAIEGLVTRGKGGMVFTPNVDHIVIAEEDALFRAAYAQADLALVDGTPVVWAARLLGSPLPQKISGSDLIRPLAERAAVRGWRLYFLGGHPGVADEAKAILEREYPGLRVVGTSAPMIDLSRDISEQRDTIEAIREVRPDLLFLALGAPKQEIFAHRIREMVGPVVMLGIGASLDFVTGKARRSPPWMSAVGLEWIYRLAQEPDRLWRRYLLRDPKFLPILFQEARSRLKSADGSRRGDVR